MAIVYPNGVTVTNIMASGTECDDLSTYLKSADQLPDLTKRLICRFIRKGMKPAVDEVAEVGASERR